MPVLKTIVSFLSALIITCSVTAQDDDLLTIAESSGYTKTATHTEVMELISRIDALSDHLHVAELGKSVEGKTLPLLIFSDSPIENAEQAKASGKTIVFAFANIHAGEVCGKEALLMLARELALDRKHELLEKLIIVLAPIYNADGNDRMAAVERNRRGQNGPKEVGVRPNADGLDLNRDYIKLESPEAQAMAAFLTKWEPHITIDCHTTNGSKHRYTLTYSAPLNPSGATEPIEFIRDTLLPEVTDKVRERTGYEMFFYGNFNRNRTIWATYEPHPRFGGQYRGLRGQMSILSEAYSYAPFKDRVLCTLEFVREIFQYADRHSRKIREIHELAKEETIAKGRNPQPDDVVGIRHKIAAFIQPVTILGYETVSEGGAGVRPEPSDTPKDYVVTHLGRFEPTLSVSRPWAYVIPSGNEDIIEKLKQHGVKVDSFDGNVRAEVYMIEKVSQARREFQGHRIVTLDTSATLKQMQFENACIVYTAQPLGNLIVYMLEPQSADGFVAWELWGDRIVVGTEYPAVRLRHSSDLLEDN